MKVRNEFKRGRAGECKGAVEGHKYLIDVCLEPNRIRAKHT